MFVHDSALSGSRRLQAAIAAVLLAGGLLAGCSPTPDATDDAASAPPADATHEGMEGSEGMARDEPGRPAAGETVGGDGSQIQLDALTENDLAEADVPGELACSFSEAQAMPILYAAGDVASDEPARGVVKVSGYVEAIHAPGGFNGIVDDPGFTGRGKTIDIAITGAPIGGGESPPRPATLTYQRADGASRTFEGRWRCGP